jgi:hypothetical protein
MVMRLFAWIGDEAQDASDAYRAMYILGHAGLEESLVYTTFRLGDDFVEEAFLGDAEMQTLSQPGHVALVQQNEI